MHLLAPVRPRDECAARTSRLKSLERRGYRHALDRKVKNGIVVTNELDFRLAKLELDGRTPRLVVVLAESEVVASLRGAINALFCVVFDTSARNTVQRFKLSVDELSGVARVVAVDAHGVGR